MSTGCNHSVLHQTKRKHQSACISRCKPYPVWKLEIFPKSPKTPVIVLIVCAPGNLQCKSIEETFTTPPFLCKPYPAITWQRASSSLIRTVENKAYQKIPGSYFTQQHKPKLKNAEGKRVSCATPPVILLLEEILHQLIGSLSHYLQGFVHPRWCRISAINSINLWQYSRCGVSEFSPCAGPYTRSNDPFQVKTEAVKVAVGG